MHRGNVGSRILFIKIRAQPCNIFVIAVYMPHSDRKQKPFPLDTRTELEQLLSKVSPHDCVILLGDLNCKLARKTDKLVGNWCVHPRSNQEGELFLDLMRKSKLVAVSTFFQPCRRKTNVTYIAKDPAYKPSQIDYILISHILSLGNLHHELQSKMGNDNSTVGQSIWPWYNWVSLQNKSEAKTKQKSKKHQLQHPTNQRGTES